MKLDKYMLAAIWIGMFILCAVLGFLPPQTGGNKWLLAILAILFFLPPALLVYLGWTQKDGKLLKILQRISVIVVSSTVTILVINLLSVALILVMPEKAALMVGDILYYLLIIVSTPMICGQFWGIGLIGWVVLLWCCVFMGKELQKKK